MLNKKQSIEFSQSWIMSAKKNNRFKDDVTIHENTNLAILFTSITLEEKLNFLLDLYWNCTFQYPNDLYFRRYT